LSPLFQSYLYHTDGQDVDDEITKTVKTTFVRRAGLFQVCCRVCAFASSSYIIKGFKRPKAVLSIGFAPDGKTLTGDSEGSIYVWSSLGSTIEVTSAVTLAHSVGSQSRHMLPLIDARTPFCRLLSRLMGLSRPGGMERSRYGTGIIGFALAYTAAPPDLTLVALSSGAGREQ
jgi:hypothetical protein